MIKIQNWDSYVKTFHQCFWFSKLTTFAGNEKPYYFFDAWKCHSKYSGNAKIYDDKNDFFFWT